MSVDYEVIYKSINDINLENREIYDNFIRLLIKDKNDKGGKEKKKVNAVKKKSDGNISSLDYKIHNIERCDIRRCDDFVKIDKLVFHLLLQLKSLEEKGFGLLFLQESDIIVINDELYLLANLSQIVPLYKKDNSQFRLVCPTIYPFPKEMCAPEILEMNALPFISHHNAIYYSLALLCLRLLKCINLSLDDLQGTKLYYFLKRCLKKDPNERLCLYF